MSQKTNVYQFPQIDPPRKCEGCTRDISDAEWALGKCAVDLDGCYLCPECAAITPNASEEELREYGWTE